MAENDPNIATTGRVQCVECKAWWPPDDIHNFGGRDYLKWAVECMGCFEKRQGKK